MNVFSSEKLTAFLTRFNERINEVCDRKGWGQNKEYNDDIWPVEFRIEMTSDGMALLSENNGEATESVPIDQLPFFMESMIQALDLVDSIKIESKS